ncbi:DUF4280 domain-containing protein [Flavobacterium reichenbachii]|jgi:hypothetical protein|uniref:DUF4280 domain-containing protein n=1 Tax=Flavobacterium reichenbachii TaxID=362418 RepID=A0A085ZDU0_9FLAO|nr:DUF4280 domain-containing protein [Flavobacterium reichenbachii]KFF02604.1 hypothetical protein IW19_23325 [Flavobacterium reichenbachii]OXB17207.1 hypothetical protein B0A68_05295 [Flavobacterium reichenbachii]
MGWFKDLKEGLSMPDYDKMFRERMEREKREAYIFDIRENIDSLNEHIAEQNIKYEFSQGINRKKEAAKKDEKEEKASDDLKMVIDGAKLQCSLCTNPAGKLKVNFDTPTTQDKKTATVKEKDMKSLIFMGNCKKSPQSSSPCASVMQLGNWKNVGTSKVQEQFPLLLKSTIKCNYGGVDIKITDCGQRSEPEDIPLTDKIFNNKRILSAKWMCEEMENEIQRTKVRKEISVLAKTKNFQEGETLTIIIDDKNGYDAKPGQKEITLTGNVDADGYVELKEMVLIEDVDNKPKYKTDLQLQREKERETEIYITRDGKDYTRSEWKKFQDDCHDKMEKLKAEKKKGFWGY